MAPFRFADRRTARQSIVLGVAVALLLLIGGLLFAGLSTTRWTAESVSIVLPSDKLDAATTASYYETLSRGQIVATFAEVASNKRFEQQAEQSLGLSPAQAASVSSEVTVAPSTSVVLIRATSSDRQVAERVTEVMTTEASGYLATLSNPYRLEAVNPGAGTAYRSSTSKVLLAGAAVIAALVGGLAVQQAIYHSLVALRSGPRLGLPVARADAAVPRSAEVDRASGPDEAEADGDIPSGTGSGRSGSWWG